MSPRLSFCVVALTALSVEALVPTPIYNSQNQVRYVRREQPQTILRMSESDDEGAIVVINEETIQQAASISSATAGFFIGGPVFALIAAAVGNYVSKQESEVGEAVRGVGKVSLEVINFFSKLNAKYDLGTKASDATSSAVSKLKEKDTEGNFEKVESALTTATSKASQLNQEYDLVEKAKQALAYAADLSDKAIAKGLELNEEYKVSEKVTDAVKTAVEKGAEKVKN
eukprot:CAMPEP_0197320778 /NCGR_PEP_ID=MMETSP0891-20130614/61658_1 /TAXON_ID=44058 ORGANISM="Aureoumbra lagunensis, Strain CCMP1510" /NCGR_SAMPLE_ID=MMETSP0891 /ASSEMBLY_ACC=CAM_ASM_000534 /LENGTH=227 /DNA_ID=CAMNT_0042812329 /DNA_START=23 /DNA_END=706 /DNA_ORIENTATION=+